MLNSVNGINSLNNSVNVLDLKLSKQDNIKGNDAIKFGDMLEGMLNKVNNAQIVSDNKIESFIKGEDVTMHEIMLSMQEAQMSMELLVETRNKVVEAYNEVNRLQL